MRKTISSSFNIEDTRLYRRIFCEVICLHLTMNCDPLTQQDKCSEYWKNKITLSSPAISSSISHNAYLALLWKLKILQCLYELIKRFATQPSSKFWKSLIITQKFTKQANNRTSKTISKQYSFIPYAKMITFWMFRETFKTCCLADRDIGLKIAGELSVILFFQYSVHSDL